VKAPELESERFKRSEAFRASLLAMSMKATYEADKEAYSVTDWALLPPPAARPESQGQASRMAHEWARIAEKLGGLPEAEAANAMLEMREEFYMNWPGHFMYFYIGPPRRRPLPVMLGVWQMDGERAEQLRMLAGFDTMKLVEAPVVEEFPTERLGTGVKVWCAQRGPNRRDEVVGLLGYAWRSEALQTDLSLRALCADLGWLQGAMPGIDEFARALRLVPRDASDGRLPARPAAGLDPGAGAGRRAGHRARGDLVRVPQPSGGDSPRLVH
jgi:hypothetical protein